MSVTVYTRIKMVAPYNDLNPRGFNVLNTGLSQIYYFCKITPPIPYKPIDEKGFLDTQGCSPNITVGTFSDMKKAHQTKIVWDFWQGVRHLNKGSVKGRLLAQLPSDKNMADHKKGTNEWPHYQPDIFSKGMFHKVEGGKVKPIEVVISKPVFKVICPRFDGHLLT